MALDLAAFLKTKWDKKYQPIIKLIHEERFLIGFERRSKRSRDYNVKLLLPFPLNLDQTVREHEQLKAQIEKGETHQGPTNV